MEKTIKKLLNLVSLQVGNKKITRGIFIGVFAIVGASIILLTSASTTVPTIEPEQAAIECAKVIPDSSASGGSAVQFTSNGCTTNNTLPGASLPISYNLSSLGSNLKYVATNGSDSNSGTSGSPYATLNKAINSSSSGGTIVIRGGTYRQANHTLNKSLKIIAYPGEIPEFSGTKPVSGGWTTEGSLKYRSYNPLPVVDGSGITFSTGVNLQGDLAGKYPDQAWVGNKELRQVEAKSSLNDDTFWVDQTYKRLYMTASNANQSNLEVSDLQFFLKATAPNTVLEGIRIKRYANDGRDSHQGVITYTCGSDNSEMNNVEIYDASFISVQYAGSCGIIKNSSMQNVTVENANWMGVGAAYTDDLTLNKVKLNGMNQFNEFKSSPQTGALKTSRTRRTKVLNSEVNNNKGHALWFDQSNVDVDVANNTLINNSGGASVFFEISDDLLLINNYIKPANNGQAVKLPGSSGMKIVNNTLIGGYDPIGIYTDVRSKPGCFDPSKPKCKDSYSSDRDVLRPLPATLDWLPRLDYMVNNIIAYPTSANFCGNTPLCITLQNQEAQVSLQSIIHKAEPGRGIPQTIMNGNVYANGSGWLLLINSVNYTNLPSFTSAMAGAPVNIAGLEAISKYGNQWVNSDGSPTNSLSSKHNEAVAIPTDADINQYLSPGTRHYGVTNK